MTSIYEILTALLQVAKWLILAQVIVSWLITFQVLNQRQPVVAQIWYGLNRLLEPVYQPLRRLLPQIGGLDLAPLVVLFVIFALERILFNNQAAFY